MTPEKIERLENRFYEQQKILGKIEGILSSIVKSIEEAISVKDEVLTIKEKCKVTENRLTKIEDKQELMQIGINGINLKIAMVSGAWSAVIFLISKM